MVYSTLAKRPSCHVPQQYQVLQDRRRKARRRGPLLILQWLASDKLRKRVTVRSHLSPANLTLHSPSKHPRRRRKALSPTEPGRQLSSSLEAALIIGRRNRSLLKRRGLRRKDRSLPNPQSGHKYLSKPPPSRQSSGLWRIVRLRLHLRHGKLVIRLTGGHPEGTRNRSCF